MVLTLRVATLLVALFFLVGVSLAVESSSTDPSLSALTSRFANGLKTFWKRRRGGWGSDSDSDSPSSSGSNSGGYEDYGDDSSTGGGGGDDGGWYTCYRPMNITREARNDGSYGDYYSVGNGHYTSNKGGYTPEGSGTPPRWDNSSGKWVALSYYESSYLSDPEVISYLGGASVPYLSGEDSPNGMHPEQFIDLPFETVPGDYLPDGQCAVPNSSYAYRYKAKFNWTSISMEEENYGEYVTRFIPVYCTCALYTPCGCDDFHQNTSFVPRLLQELGLYMSPRNVSDLCSIDIKGETALLVNGSLANGSTKADRTVSRLTETVSTTVSTRCLAGTGAPDEVSGAHGLVEPSQRAFGLAWTGVIGFAVLLGMCLVLL
ncbi:uncharacterized protein BJX67DRAFT_384183 [Aspergillus lucknowensis]|uniref:DUF7732 domain-containing protein n=1 Tax=Aspergillus lucknowensis TaxID=176173 RepID=A0ABR4LHH4_9EURO